MQEWTSSFFYLYFRTSLNNFPLPYQSSPGSLAPFLHNFPSPRQNRPHPRQMHNLPTQRNGGPFGERRRRPPGRDTKPAQPLRENPTPKPLSFNPGPGTSPIFITHRIPPPGMNLIRPAIIAGLISSRSPRIRCSPTRWSRTGMPRVCRTAPWEN